MEAEKTVEDDAHGGVARTQATICLDKGLTSLDALSGLVIVSKTGASGNCVMIFAVVVLEN